MDPRLSNFLHVSGVLLLFTGYGIIFAAAKMDQIRGAVWRSGQILAGVGLLLLFVFGFATMHTFQWPAWGFGKLGLWVLLGVLPVLLRRRVINPAGFLAVTYLLGLMALYFVYFRPF